MKLINYESDITDMTQKELQDYALNVSGYAQNLQNENSKMEMQVASYSTKNGDLIDIISNLSRALAGEG